MAQGLPLEETRQEAIPEQEQLLEVSTNLLAGRLCHFYHTWERLTQNTTILSWIRGYKISFDSKPIQKFLPKQLNLLGEDIKDMAQAMEDLLSKGAVVQCTPCAEQFISNVFMIDKPNGKKRFILNLKQLNNFVHTPHFKLEDHKVVSQIIQGGHYLGHIDLKDAYYLIPIDVNHRKYLRFTYDRKLFEFTCLPFGLSSAPYCYTKLIKPIVSHLRKRGILSVNYLDDFLILGESAQVCSENIRYTINLLKSLGFIINHEKSNLIPSKRIKFLGYIYDSDQLSVELPLDKKKSIQKWATHFLNKRQCKIRRFAKFIGILIAACPAIKYSWLYTKNFERIKCSALRANNMDYNAIMKLPDLIKKDLKWWIQNVNSSRCFLKSQNFKLTMYTDASLTGWGACCDTGRTHGFWSDQEQSLHINILELRAILYGLKCFTSDLRDCNILLRCDNTTAISYINRMGSIKYPALYNLSREIWQWCEERNLWIFASYITSKDNWEADKESRVLKKETEWSLSGSFFQSIVKNLGQPEIDLFASNINTKCRKYFSWVKDPGSIGVDAFTFPWRDLKFYAFPPFLLILRVLQKIIQDKAEGIVVVPLWSAQPWFPLFKKLLVSNIVTLGPSSNMLISPFSKEHPLKKSLILVAARLSGKRFLKKESQKRPSIQ